jgi:putative radical SAM enzyme (TIGR03279 family)
VEVLSVTPGSLAEKAGIVPGNRILAVNGREVRDFLDLHLWLGDEVLDLVVKPAKDAPDARRVRIVREYGEALGLGFPDQHIRRCANDCPFCFVDQLPEGLRKSLYIRDDDYRFSYLYGHFITLTNIREIEFMRIVEQQLSPLYISVHALDPDVRERILVSPRAREIRDRLEQLIGGGITLHTQIVVVPGVNDGAVLEETIFGLADYYPGVQTVSVVPVGLTAHRKNLPAVGTLTRKEARGIVRSVRRYGRSMQRRLGTEFCFVADEMFILAGGRMPGSEYYGDFGQRENGVGLVRSTLMRFAGDRPRGAELARQGIRRVWITSGESFAPVLHGELSGLRAKLPEVAVEAIVVPNRLFGRPVTVAGLLGGRDLLDAVRGRVTPGQDLVLVPDEAVNENGVFLDDLTPADLERELGVPVAASWDPILEPDSGMAGPFPTVFTAEADGTALGTVPS